MAEVNEKILKDNQVVPTTENQSAKQEDQGNWLYDLLKGGVESAEGIAKSDTGKLLGRAAQVFIPGGSLAVKGMDTIISLFDMYSKHKMGNVQAELMRNIIKNSSSPENVQSISEQIQPGVGGRGTVDNGNTMQMQLADMLNNKQGDNNKQLMTLLQMISGLGKK